MQTTLVQVTSNISWFHITRGSDWSLSGVQMFLVWSKTTPQIGSSIWGKTTWKGHLDLDMWNIHFMCVFLRIFILKDGTTTVSFKRQNWDKTSLKATINSCFNTRPQISLWDIFSKSYPPFSLNFSFWGKSCLLSCTRPTTLPRPTAPAACLCSFEGTTATAHCAPCVPQLLQLRQRAAQRHWPASGEMPAG